MTGTDLKIPDHLKPRDGHFCSGPCKVRPEQLGNLADKGTYLLGRYHRRDPIISLVGKLREGLHELFQLPDGYEVALGNGGTSAFWDIAAFSLIRERAQLFSYGIFSAKFADIVRRAPFLADPTVVEAELGSAPKISCAPAVDFIAWTENETTTGVTVPVRRPAQSDGALIAIDAASSAGGILVDPSQFDAYYFAPQKGFGADAALWIALLSPAALERVEEISRAGRWMPDFLSLRIALEYSRTNQTYNTPGVAMLILFMDQIEWMLNNGGLAWAAGRSAESARRLYEWAEKTSYAAPFVADPMLRSPTVGAVKLADNVDAAALNATLRANGIHDTEAYRMDQYYQLRIGMLPAVDPDDVSALTECIDWVVERL